MQKNPAVKFVINLAGFYEYYFYSVFEHFNQNIAITLQ